MMMVSIHGLLSAFGRFAIETIFFFGYSGVFFLMMLESMIFPIPSELVMPFAGFLAAEGRFNFWLVILFSTFGSLAGSLLSYYIGLHGGHRFVRHYGKYFLLGESDLKRTEEWFSKKGEKMVLISRFVPVVRHLISIPAGMGKMNLKKFCIYTVIGAGIWNAFLAYLGLKLGEHWMKVREYTEYFTVAVVVLLLFTGTYFVYRHIRHKKSRKQV